MIIRINKILKEYLIQAINSFIYRYHWLPEQLRKLLKKLEEIKGR